MKVVKSILYGYAGAILAGLLVAIAGVTFGLPEPMIVAAAGPTGLVFGLLGLSWVWWRPLVHKAKIRRRDGR
ncbi:MAG TPA: hypothetical protein VLL72_05600 [Kiloniellales bacterium]|nr:hypothetical protein [Kiloniellales bacterium]